MQHLFAVPWLIPSRRTLRGIAVVAILVFGFFVILKSTSGEREAPAKELVTGSIPRAASVPKPPPNDPMRWIDAPFRCRARDQNGCNTRWRGSAGRRASSMPRPSYDRS